MKGKGALNPGVGIGSEKREDLASDSTPAKYLRRAI